MSETSANLHSGERANALDIEGHLGELRIIADFVRKDVFEIIEKAQNGHIGGSSSSVELLTAMYFGGQFNFAPDNPEHPDRDRVLIRGHEGPVRYPIFSLLGYIDREELWTYRRLGSRLQGHEDMHETPGVDITPSGSLGMLLSYGVGASVAAKEKNKNNRTIVFLGDGEEQEGNVSEAARHASSIGLDNIICIIDKNTKQLSRPTAESDGGANLGEIWHGYGWDVLEIENGHDLKEIMDTYEKLQTLIKPTVVIANTVKGFGVEGSEEHFSGYHTLSAMADRSLLSKAIEGLGVKLGEKVSADSIQRLGRALVRSPDSARSEPNVSAEVFDIRYKDSGLVNMEEGQSQYFSELAARIKRTTDAAPLYVITPDLLRTDVVAEIGFDSFVTKYLDTGLREQHAVAMAHGISTYDPNARIYMCYGDAFLFRAADQMNAAATGGSSMLIAGENAGLFQGQNGKTHQSIGQTGALMQIPEATVLEPADAHDLFNVFSDTFLSNNSFTYVRLHRGDMNILERDQKDLRNTDAYAVHKPEKVAKLVIAASGFMVESAVKAAKDIEIEHGLPTLVINVVNQKTLADSLPDLLDNDAPILTVYNGNPRTLQANVSAAILGSPDIPRPRFVAGHGFEGGTSGSVADLIRYYRIDAAGIKDLMLESLAKYGNGGYERINSGSGRQQSTQR